MSASIPLLHTKFHAPRPRSLLTERPRLVDALNEAFERRLALVSAPAGFGKSTLVSAWAAKTGLPVAWLSLDGDDNEPLRFWSYLVAALQTAQPGLGQETFLWLQAARSAPGDKENDLKPALTLLINELNDLSRHIVLVLDDYHSITVGEIHQSLVYWIEHLPPTLVLVVVTRVDPPLPLPRLRARGELAELRAAELRFTAGETGQFLRSSMNLPLEEGEIETLEQRTEGWVAGLQLAALSMKGQSDPRAFLRDFTGSNRYILDYLTEEVLARQPEETKSFLLQTAVLDRFNASLCEAVIDRLDIGLEDLSPQTVQPDHPRLTAADFQRLIDQLERSNLFLIPLDDERRWFRYHHLFADLLRVRLKQMHPDHIAQIHARAAAWFDANELHDEAVSRALAAGETGKDYSLAARLIGKYWVDLVHQGEVRKVQRWLAALPVDGVTNSPVLSIAMSWASFLSGNISSGGPYLHNAEHALARQEAQGSTDTDEYYSAKVNVHLLHALQSRYQNDPKSMLQHAQRAFELADPQDALLRGNALFFIGFAYLAMGAADPAAKSLKEAIPLQRRSGNHYATGLNVFYAAQILCQQGRLRESEEVCRETLEWTASHGLQRFPSYGQVYLALAEVLREWNRLDEAKAHILHAMELGQQGGMGEMIKRAWMVLARIALSRKEYPSALEAVGQAARLVEESPSVSLSMAEVQALRAWLLLDQSPEETARWIEGIESRPGTALEAGVYARARLKEVKAAKALERLTTALDAAEQAGQRNSAIELLALRAIAYRTLGRREEAYRDLRSALEWGQPEGYLRVFLDEGQALASLLAEMKDHFRLSPTIQAYCQEILKVFGQEPVQGGLQKATPPPAPMQAPTAPALLVEPLTERELEVLRLVYEGHSNQEIADRLVISLPTVKKHISSILGKLGVKSRTQAAAAARSLGLV